jgi:hypothetical protein
MIIRLGNVLLLVAFAAAGSPAQRPPFLLTGPTHVDLSQRPRDLVGQIIVELNGTGFVPQMLLVGYAGQVGPFVIPFRFVDNHAIEIAMTVVRDKSATFALYKFDNGTFVGTPQLHTQFTLGGLAANAVFVSTAGSDSNPGTLTAPFRTIARGILALAPGMTLYVRGGTYFERPVVAVSGTESQWITIQSFPGERAVIDSGPTAFRTRGNNDWELVNAATGEWRSVAPAPSGMPYGYVDGIPGYRNGRVGLVPYASRTCFRATSSAYVNSSTPFYVGPGLYRDSTTGRLHVRLQKTADMQAVESRYGRVFPVDRPDPRGLSIVVSQADSTLTVRGSYLAIRDLVVNQGLRSIDLPATVSNVLIENVEVWLGDAAISSTGNGSRNITITRCRVYGDDPAWIFWTDAKVDPAPADRMRQTSIDFHNGASNVVISYNHVRGGHDLVGVNTDEDNFFVHHNVLENCQDDAAEFEGTTDIGRIEFHHNFVLNPLVAISPGQDSRATSGPLLFYNNVFASLRNPPVNRRPGIVTWNGGGRHGFEYMLKQHSGNTFYYHNTMVLLNSAGQGIDITPRRPAGTVCANNILITVNGKVNGDYRTGTGQIVDGNLYWRVNAFEPTDLVDRYDTVPQLFAARGLERSGVGAAPRRGTDPLLAGLDLVADVRNDSLIMDLVVGSEVRPIEAFLLRAGSPARGAGILIPAHPVFGPLPDANASRDLGAFRFGNPMDVYRGFPFDQVR